MGKRNDMTDFEMKVLEMVSRIPRGCVTAYGIIAKEVGAPRSARAVGNALNKNPRLITYPCHRVVMSDGCVGGYAGGVKKKMALLRAEGVKIQKGRVCGRFYRF